MTKQLIITFYLPQKHISLHFTLKTTKRKESYAHLMHKERRKRIRKEKHQNPQCTANKIPQIKQRNHYRTLRLHFPIRTRVRHDTTFSFWHQHLCYLFFVHAFAHALAFCLFHETVLLFCFGLGYTCGWILVVNVNGATKSMRIWNGSHSSKVLL